MSELRELLNETVDVEASTVEGPPPSDTVTTADRWTRRTGERLVSEWQRLGMKRDASDDDSELVAADAVETLLATAPTLAEHPVDEHRSLWWKQLLEST